MQSQYHVFGHWRWKMVLEVFVPGSWREAEQLVDARVVVPTEVSVAVQLEPSLLWQRRQAWWPAVSGEEASHHVGQESDFPYCDRNLSQILPFPSFGAKRLLCMALAHQGDESDPKTLLEAVGVLESRLDNHHVDSLTLIIDMWLEGGKLERRQACPVGCWQI